MKVSVLTCSTNRPEALALCRLYVRRQSYRIHEHLLSQHSDFWGNMHAGLKEVTGDIVVIFEDDDWYPANWVEWCVTWLKNADMFGQKRLFNYHIPSGGYEDAILKRDNAPMHATAFRSFMIPEILAIPEHEGKPQLDVELWKIPCRKEFTRELRVVSMKGMPGAKGYSVAHDASHYTKFDKNRKVLRRLIGDDAELYKEWTTCSIT